MTFGKTKTFVTFEIIGSDECQDLDFEILDGKARPSKDDDAALLRIGRIMDVLHQDKARVLLLTNVSQDDLDAVVRLLVDSLGMDRRQIRTEIRSS